MRLVAALTLVAAQLLCVGSLRHAALLRPRALAAFPPRLRAHVVRRAPRVNIALANEQPPLASHAEAVRESVLRILSHDVMALQIALRNEGARCARAVQRTATEEAQRILRGYGISQPIFSASRVLSATLEQPRRLALLVGSYVHWRMPLARWWAESWAMCATEAMSESLSKLQAMAVPAGCPVGSRVDARGDAESKPGALFTPWRAEMDLQVCTPRPPAPHARPQPFPPRCCARGGTRRRRALTATRAPHGSVALPLPQQALLHLRPQILAKVRHAARHEPSSLGTFVAISVRLALLVPLWRISVLVSRLLGVQAFGLRRSLIRCALRDAARASERCNRVELRQQLLPVPPPRDLYATSASEPAAAVAGARSAR